MPLVRFRSVVWNNPAFHLVIKWAKAVLALGQPATYRIGPGAGQEWLVFADQRFTLEQFAILGAIAAADPSDLSGWTPPLLPGGEVDRPAAEAEIAAMVTVVDPADITYDEDDPNSHQTTIDAQPGSPATIKAEPAPDVAWKAQE